jgi:hypothetical protein
MSFFASLGLMFGVKTGPLGVFYKGSIAGENASLSGNITLTEMFIDSSVWISIIGTFGQPTAVSIGGVAATKYVEFIDTLTGFYFSWWKASDVEAGVKSLVVTNPGYSMTAGVYQVTGVLGGKNPTPQHQAAYVDNSNTATVNFASRVINDVFVGMGVKTATGSDQFTNITGSPAEAGLTEVNRNGVVGNNTWGMQFATSVLQTGTSAATITANGTDSSNAIGLSVLRFSKA